MLLVLCGSYLDGEFVICYVLATVRFKILFLWWHDGAKLRAIQRSTVLLVTV